MLPPSSEAVAQLLIITIEMQCCDENYFNLDKNKNNAIEIRLDKVKHFFLNCFDKKQDAFHNILCLKINVIHLLIIFNLFA